MKPKKELNMKKLFRRNQVIITTLAVMIAAAGYLNYAGKQELAAGSEVFEAGMLEISDEDILAENQANANYGETLYEIGSLDQDFTDDTTVEEAMMETEAQQWADSGMDEGWRPPAIRLMQKHRSRAHRKAVLTIREKPY